MVRPSFVYPIAAPLLKALLLAIGVAAVGCSSSNDVSTPGGGTGGSSNIADGGSDSPVGNGGMGGTGDSGPADAAGNGGSASTHCATDPDCATKVPKLIQTGCAEGYCNPATNACQFRARDQDGDGHRGIECSAVDGTPVETGDDCNDTDPSVHPGAWDGPAEGSKADACDGMDQDCNSKLDDGVASDGKSCSCVPGDTVKCSEDGGGHVIIFPKLDENGNPLGACKLGKKTCGANGKYGPCIGAVAPDYADRCDSQDENCNGLVDMQDTIPPLNQVIFTFDGDGDNFADAAHPAEAKTMSCPSTPPETCPSYLDTTRFPCDPAVQWRTVALPLKDCDDNDASRFPGAVELCNLVDDDCNGTLDDSYAIDAANWVFDYDGDGAGDVSVPPVHQCDPPKALPAGCADLQANTPLSYCAGVAAEGTAPDCPATACQLSMWKKGLPQSDCKDRPDEGVGGTKGNKPWLVHPGGKDLCNGLDYDCDGASDTGCGCSPLGATRDCGTADTCNVGTQTCMPGGYWDSCTGGEVKPKLDYCPDKDSDGYCDLSKCIPTLCPQQAAAGFKAKGQCFSLTDCDDAHATVHPGGGDICNGDGLDHNCNGVTNTVGAGDCSCVAGQTGLACAPAGYVYPSGVKPGDKLVGICQWGTQACNPDGSLTPCTGGHTGYPAEQCWVLDGADNDCNGVPNTQECACANGDLRSCEAQAKCNKGCIQTCINGQWSPESVPAHPVMTDCYADFDRDGTCGIQAATAKCPPSTWGNDPDAECSTNCVFLDNGRNWRKGANCIGSGNAGDCNDASALVRPYFTQGDAWACGAGIPFLWTQAANIVMERCGDSIDSDCLSGDNNGYDVGTFCDNSGDWPVGSSCYQTSSKACSSPGSTTTICPVEGKTWSDAPDLDGSTTQLHGSWDTNCNGKVEYRFPEAGGTIHYCNSTPCKPYHDTKASPAPAQCNNLGKFCLISTVACNSSTQPYGVITPCGGTDSVGNGDSEWNWNDAGMLYTNTPKCGTTYVYSICKWNGTTCAATQETVETQWCK